MGGSANTGWTGTDSHIHYHFPKHPLSWKPVLPLGLPKAMWPAINNKLRSTIYYEALNPLISQQYCFEDEVAYFCVEGTWRFEVAHKELPKGTFFFQKLCSVFLCWGWPKMTVKIVPNILSQSQQFMGNYFVFAPGNHHSTLWFWIL